jgi:serine/threonine protein kinase
MEVERQRKVEELFHAALRLPADQRVSFLERACEHDARLQEEVTSLLAYESAAREFMDEPALELAAKRMAEEISSDENTILHSSGRERYRLLEQLGRGGMGVVYKAEDTRLRRMVALKFLPPELARDAFSLERFEREAHAASSLNHPNICTIYDIGELRGRPFIAMELLQGQTLEQRIGGQPIPVNELIAIAIQISDALRAAHTRGIIHRDIKPSNIFITTTGEAKVLDFGLAKLEGTESLKAATNGSIGPTPLHVSSLTLTRTGLAIGTASYMSPEQIRADKLDVRTDLFSLGLVLYEMATGQQAFIGTSVSAIQEAILEKAPSEVHELNPKLPAPLDGIVTKALRKERAERYQSASELRADLTALRDELDSDRHLARRLLIGGAMLMLVTSAGFLIKSRQSSPSGLRAFKQRQLTANSSENQIKSGAISPDGKYLAYSDLSGIYIKGIEVEKTIAVPRPNDPVPAKWEVGPWLADSTGFMATLDTLSSPPNYWFVPLSGGGPRKIRDDVNPYSYSPLNSWLAVTMKEDPSQLGGHEIWLMKPNGDQPRRISEAGGDSIFRWLTWSPNGERLAYIRDQSVAGRHDISIESRDVNGGSSLTILAGADMGGFAALPSGEQAFVWLPHGLVYANGEPGSLCPTNLFEARVNERTGALLEKPKQITNWAGFCIFNLGSSADGRRLVFARQSEQRPVYAASYDAKHRRLNSSPSRITLTEDHSIPVGWSPDGREILFVSDREGSWGIYRQSVNESTAEALVTRLPGVPQASVDFREQQLLYISPNSSPSAGATSILMRVPLSGGTPQEVLRGDFNGFGCAWSHGSRCVLGQVTPDQKEIVFSSLNSSTGLGVELARFRSRDANELAWELSPDGRQVVLFKAFTERIRLLSLEEKTVREIKIKGSLGLRTLTWAADSKGWFASFAVQQGAQLTHVDGAGNARALWEDKGQNVFVLARAARDGVHLAIAAGRQTTNMWMIEDF